MAELVLPDQEGRNVIVVGKTGCGKSSLCNMIIGRSYKKFTSAACLSSVTKEVSHRITHFERKDDEPLLVAIFDTMGLFDTSMMSNLEIMKKVKQYANKYAPSGVNLILFVLKQGRFTPEEKEAFDFVAKRFGREISGISALVITHCDTDSEETRKALVNDFRRNEATREIANFMKQGIYTVGFPNEADTLPYILKAIDKEIEKDRKKIRDLIERSHATVLAKELYEPSWWMRCTIL